MEHGDMFKNIPVSMNRTRKPGPSHDVKMAIDAV